MNTPIYRRCGDEIRVYRDVMPRKDGGEPFATASLVKTGLVVIAALLGLIAWFVEWHMHMELGSEILRSLYLSWGTVAAFLVLSVFSGERLIFSGKTGTIQSGRVFRKTLGQFADVSRIELMRVGDFSCFSLVWLERGRPPLRISPMVTDDRRLARYHHDVVPLLTETMALPAWREGEIGEEVGGGADFGESEGGAKANAAAPGLDDILGGEYRFFVYNRRTGLFRQRFAWKPVLVVAGLSACLLGLLYWVYLFGDLLLTLACVCALPVILWLNRKESMTIRLDPKRRRILSYTCYGLRKREYSADDVVAASFVQLASFIVLFLHFRPKGSGTVSALTVSSAQDMREGMDELGRIMGIRMDRLGDRA